MKKLNQNDISITILKINIVGNRQNVEVRGWFLSFTEKNCKVKPKKFQCMKNGFAESSKSLL